MSVRSIMKSPNVLLVSGIAFNSAPNVIQTGAYTGGGGGIDTIVAGDGINVDNTDPANPEVSANYDNVADYNNTGTIENCAGIQISSGGLTMDPTAVRFTYQCPNPIVITDVNSGIQIQNGTLEVGGESTLNGDVSCVGDLTVNGAITSNSLATLDGLTVTAPFDVTSTSHLQGMVTVGAAGVTFGDGSIQTTAYLGGGGGGSNFNTLITGSDGLNITGGATIIEGGATITAGGLGVSGGLAVSAGNLGVTLGNITVAVGGITATAGAITATAGAVVAGTSVTAGNGITANTGNITATTGNIVATTGTLSATRGLTVTNPTGASAVAITGQSVALTSVDNLTLNSGNNYIVTQTPLDVVAGLQFTGALNNHASNLMRIVSGQVAVPNAASVANVPVIFPNNFTFATIPSVIVSLNTLAVYDVIGTSVTASLITVAGCTIDVLSGNAASIPAGSILSYIAIGY